jgi:hypothetical protein
MVINLTQHPATPEQITAGVIDLPAEVKEVLVELLTFRDLPIAQEIISRAQDIAELAAMNGLGGDDGDDPLPNQAMIGGALWLMAPLESALRANGIEPVYAFSIRETQEHRQADGSIKKVAVFRHAGFVPAVATINQSKG